MFIVGSNFSQNLAVQVCSWLGLGEASQDQTFAWRRAGGRVNTYLLNTVSLAGRTKRFLKGRISMGSNSYLSAKHTCKQPVSPNVVRPLVS